MIRRSADSILMSIVLLLLATLAQCQNEGGKYKILSQLTGASKAQLSSRSAAQVASRAEAAQLELDLIFYNWASDQSDLTTDVNNVDTIIPALAKAFRPPDPVMEWSLSEFTNARLTSPPPQNNDQIAQLSDLEKHYRTALDCKVTSPLQAAKALTVALDITKNLHLDLSQALVLEALGDHYRNMTRYHEAEDCYSNAALTYSLYDCTESCARVNGHFGEINVGMGKYSAAADRYRTSAQYWVSLSERQPNEPNYRTQAGREYIKAGEAQEAAGDTEKAFEYMTHALDHLRNAAFMTKTAKSYARFIKDLMRVAEVYRAHGNTSKALDLLEEAQTDLKVERDPLVAAKVYADIAATYTAANQTSNAQAAERKRQRSLAEAITDGNAAMTALNNEHSLLSTALANVQKAEKGAIAYREFKQYAQSADVWRKLVDICKRAGFGDDLVECLQQLATVLDLQGRSKESLQTRLDAVTTARKLNKKALAADAGKAMVQALIQSGDLSNALEVFKDLVSIFEDAGDVGGAAAALAARGQLLSKDGQYRQTSQDLQGAKAKFEAAVDDLRDARAQYLEKVGDPWAAGEASRQLAAAQVGLSQIQDARATLESALKIIEDVSEDVDPTANPDHSNIIRNLYAALATVYVRDGSENEASQLLRNARRYPWIMDLVDSLRNGTDPIVAKFASDLDLVRPTPTHTGATAPTGEHLLAADWAAFLKTCLMLKEQYSDVYNALPVDPLDIYKNRHLLPRHGEVIEYMPTQASIYVFVCGYGKVICRELGARSQSLDGPIAQLRKSLKNSEERMSSGIGLPRTDNWQEPEFLEIKKPLIDLYTNLVAPIRQDIDPEEPLIFALPEKLAGLPMHALISSDPGQTPRFLIQDHAVSYLSEGMFDDLVGRDNRTIDVNSDRLVIFADPQNNLPGARREATALTSAYYMCQLPYVGNNATVAHLKQACETAGILHIAAHYKIDPNPNKFQIQLAPSGDSDGTLGIDELSALTNHPLALVVLSACDSVASSDPVSSGPSRAAVVFSLAGAKSVLGGLWKVSDDAASKVMVGFYRSLGRLSRAESLRRAQMDVIASKDYAHPFYWACFALYGNPR